MTFTQPSEPPTESGFEDNGWATYPGSLEMKTISADVYKAIRVGELSNDLGRNQKVIDKRTAASAPDRGNIDKVSP
jgi:hypothetical protein